MGLVPRKLFAPYDAAFVPGKLLRDSWRGTEKGVAAAADGEPPPPFLDAGLEAFGEAGREVLREGACEVLREVGCEVVGVVVGEEDLDLRASMSLELDLGC